jgi:hypothetical protein
MVFDANCGMDRQQPHFSTAWHATWTPAAITRRHSFTVQVLRWHRPVWGRDMQRKNASRAVASKPRYSRGKATCLLGEVRRRLDGD